MDAKILEGLINEGLSIREIADRTSKGDTTIRYWLKRNGLETRNKIHNVGGKANAKHKCKCGETDPSKFYGNKKQICAKCHNSYNSLKGAEKKEKARLYLGGECKICGYDKYKVALDIHHLDPSIKDAHFKSMRGWSWDKIHKEIKNCILLCRNCHAAVHAGLLKT